MSWRRELAKLGALFRRPRPVDDLEEEIRSHLEMEEQKNLESGMAPDEAHYAALREFGNVTLVQETCREMWGWNSLETLWQDIRFGLRMLAKNPGFTAVAMLTLALGIGANAAIFSAVNSVLIKPLPYPDSQRLVQVFESLPGFDRNSVSGGAFKDWHEQSSKFSYLAVYEENRLNLTGVGMPERISGLMVSSEFLSVLGVAPVVGRNFAGGEDAVGGNNRVIILTNALWQSRFGGDASIVGRTVALDQIPYTVIGVLPPNALLQDDEMFLVPDVIDAPGVNWKRAGHWRQVIGRLLPGVTPSEAQAELRGIKQRLNAEYPPFKNDWSVTVVPMHEVYAGDTRRTAPLS
jgi:hypothetical protein